MYREHNGRLIPKKSGEFTYTFHWDEPGLKYDSGATYDASETNAVHRHQLNQEGFPTSGISTTPHLNQAKVYARGRDGRSAGYVFRIDRSKLADQGVREYVVAKFVKDPSIPKDEEVILVTRGANLCQNRSSPK
jgi:hypothetical protein